MLTCPDLSKLLFFYYRKEGGKIGSQLTQDWSKIVRFSLSEITEQRTKKIKHYVRLCPIKLSVSSNEMRAAFLALCFLKKGQGGWGQEGQLSF